MDITGFKPISFDNKDLIPERLAQELPLERYFITNPSIQRFNEQWLMAYIVNTPGYRSERFAICRLNNQFSVIPGSVVLLSDTIPNITPQVGGPRLLVYAGKLWVLYCHFRLPSLLYLAEIDPNTLHAVGSGRPLLLDDRQWQEKNWMPFEYEGELLAVYSISPHVVLHLDLESAAVIRCRRIHSIAWDVSAYARRFGQPRGGTPPVRVGDAYYMFFHSRYFENSLHAAISPAWQALRARLGRPVHWDGPRQADGDVRPIQATTDWVYKPKRLPFYIDGFIRRYEMAFARCNYPAGFYGFHAHPPFEPFSISSQPVLRADDEQAPQRSDRLSPLNDRVVYPSGAVHLLNQRWLVSFGIHDERCMLREVELAPGLMR